MKTDFIDRLLERIDVKQPSLIQLSIVALLLATLVIGILLRHEFWKLVYTVVMTIIFILPAYMRLV